MTIKDLEKKVIKLKLWSIETTEHSEESISSYAGLEMKLIAHKFTFEDEVSGIKIYPQNLYRDSQIKTLI